MSAYEITLTILLVLNVAGNIVQWQLYRMARKRGTRTFQQVSEDIDAMMDRIRKRDEKRNRIKVLIPWGRWINGRHENLWLPNIKLAMSPTEQLRANIQAGGIPADAQVHYDEDGRVRSVRWVGEVTP